MSKDYDILVIGGGVNGCGIARDAAGRGLKVALCEKDDLAQATSSASSKLFHGGLRYLEHYKFRLVRESLIERELLLKAMPHISWPMRFVLPHHDGLRSAWLLRLGLFIYDHLGGRKILPAAKTLNLLEDEAGTPLKDSYVKGFEYSDCWVEDSRLVVLNALDASNRGADIFTRTIVKNAWRDGNLWRAEVQTAGNDASREIRAKAIVNAGGPWVSEILNQRLGQNSKESVRLVRGSHIVTKKLFDHDKPYIFQQADGRIVFAMPYQTYFTLIGTTDKDHDAELDEVVCTPEEQTYLLNAASEYFQSPVTDEDVVWSYSGVRPLYEDNASEATEATRDYVLSLQDADQMTPLLNVFGGKITTHRRLAEMALRKLVPYFPLAAEPWTAGVALPGGDFPVDGVDPLVQQLERSFSFLTPEWALRLVRAYGTNASKIMGDAKTASDLGRDFGATLTEAELNWLIKKEWAQSADDVLWRRSKLGLFMNSTQKMELAQWFAEINLQAA